MPPPLFDRVPRWMIAYGVLMAGAAVGNVIGGVPAQVSWHLLIGGAVALIPAIQRYINAHPPALAPRGPTPTPIAPMPRDRIRALPEGDEER